jgi:ribosome biogenesis GTPase A
VVTKAWLTYFNAQPGVKAVGISAKKAGEVARIPSLCQSLAPHRNDNIKPLRMMIMGIPNVGKSTLMNALVKRRVAAVGDEPAVTKSQQTIELSLRHILIDTPGMMWPKIEHDADGYMLAASHAIGRNAVIDEEVAVELTKILLARYPALLAARYKINPDEFDAPGIVEEIAKRRACRLKGGGWDLEKAAMILLTDYRSGTLGRISLETPETRVAMLRESISKAPEPSEVD